MWPNRQETANLVTFTEEILNKKLHCFWGKILIGVPQGSILGSFLFNIFLCDLFIIMNKTDFACYVDENTPYVTASNINVVMLLLSLEKGSDKLLQWFFDNQKKANSDKYYFLVNGKVKETVGVTKTEIKKSDCEKLPGIKTDPEHNFSADLNDRISKASRKVNVLSRIKIT